MLQKQIYTTDVLLNKVQHEGGQLEHKAYHDNNRRIVELTSHSLSSRFPDEVTWGFDEQLEHTVQTEIRCQIHDHGATREEAEFVAREKYPKPSPICIPPESILHWAAAKGRINTTEMAIDAAKMVWPAYLDLGHPQSLHKPIHVSAINGHLGITKLLVNYAGISPTSTSGFQCLFSIYSTKELHEMIKHFVPNIELKELDQYKFGSIEYPFIVDALGLSILSGHEDVATWLLEHYDITQYKEVLTDFDPHRQNVALFKRPHTAFYEGDAICPLHLAALVGMDSIAQSLIEKGVHTDFRCKQLQNSTALMWACTRQENERIVDRLISYGADTHIFDENRRSALVWALEHKLPGIAYRLVEAGVALDDPAWIVPGGSPLLLIIMDDIFLDCTKLILQMCPDLQDIFVNRNFQQALFDLPPKINDETMRFCINNDIGQGFIPEPYFNSPTDADGKPCGRLPIHVAAGSHVISLKVTRWLLEKHPQNTNQRDNYGRTPLLVAAQGYRPEYKKMALLLSYGADPGLSIRYFEERNNAFTDLEEYTKQVKVLKQRIAKATIGDFEEEPDMDHSIIWLDGEL